MVNSYATLHLNVTPEGPNTELHDMRTTWSWHHDLQTGLAIPDRDAASDPRSNDHWMSLASSRPDMAYVRNLSWTVHATSRHTNTLPRTYHHHTHKGTLSWTHIVPCGVCSCNKLFGRRLVSVCLDSDIGWYRVMVWCGVMCVCVCWIVLACSRAVQACRLPALKPLEGLKSLAAACTQHSGHRPLLLERCSLPFASIALCCSGVQACRLPALKPLKGIKSLAAACTQHSGHRPLLLERCSLLFASIALCC